MRKTIRDVINWLYNCLTNSAVYDVVVADGRDLQYKDKAGYADSAAARPSKFSVVDDEFVNQNVDGYKMSCTAQSVCNAINNSGKIWHINNTYSGFKLFDKAVVLGMASRTLGAYLIKLIKLAHKLGWFHSYYQTNTLEEIKTAIYDCCNVVTGSTKIDWKECREDGLVKTVSKGSGHAFTIVGWDDEKQLLQCENSYGAEYAGTGYFYIPYSLVEQGILFNTKKALVVNRLAFSK